jgi:hypothetical protein
MANNSGPNEQSLAVKRDIYQFEGGDSDLEEFQDESS